MTRVVLNGRFLAQPHTGVQRYARETVLALDALVGTARRGIRAGAGGARGGARELAVAAHRIAPTAVAHRASRGSR